MAAQKPNPFGGKGKAPPFGGKGKAPPFGGKTKEPFGQPAAPTVPGGKPPGKGKKPFGFAGGGCVGPVIVPGSIDDGKPSGGGKAKGGGAATKGLGFQGTF